MKHLIQDDYKASLVTIGKASDVWVKTETNTTEWRENIQKERKKNGVELKYVRNNFNNG